MNLVYLGLGANLGDKQKQILQALELLAANQNISLKMVSSFYPNPPLTLDPVLTADTPWYLNAVCLIETDYNPRELFGCLQNIEITLGRKPAAKWSSRVIDIDILLYNEEIINEANLTIPHPEMTKRDFVMKPLHEIAPQAYHPKLQKNIGELVGLK